MRGVFISRICVANSRRDSVSSYFWKAGRDKKYSRARSRPIQGTHRSHLQRNQGSALGQEPDQTSPTESERTQIQRLLTFHEGRDHLTARTLQRHLQELVNEEYLREFIVNP